MELAGRLGMDRTCGAVSAKGRKEGTWRRTVPVARLRCQDREEEETFGHTISVERRISCKSFLLKRLIN